MHPFSTEWVNKKLLQILKQSDFYYQKELTITEKALRL